MADKGSQGAVDVLGFLPGPATKGNASACDLLAGEAFAYGVASAVAIVDVHKMQLACTLQGGHKNAAVTAIAWCPECHGRDARTPNLRLASGDIEGRVVVWDVSTGNTIASMEDPVAAATGMPTKRTDAKGGAAKDLAWILSDPCMLAIILANGLFLVWDPRGGGIVFKKDFGADAALSSMRVDPSDRRHVCLCGARGALSVLRFAGGAKGRVEQQQYRVDMTGGKQGDTLRCCFSATHDLLYVLLPREVVVFDLEFGQPAASTSLPASRPAFKDILGCFGHAIVGKSPSEGGIDLLYCIHQDGSLSAWRRQPGQLTYALLCLHRLVPPPSRVSNNASLALPAIAARVWVRCTTDALRSTVLPPPAHSTTEFAIEAAGGGRRNHLRDSGTGAGDEAGLPLGKQGLLLDQGKAGAAILADTTKPPALAAVRVGSGANAPALAPAAIPAAGGGGASGVASPEARPESLLVMAVSDDGHVWQWDAPIVGLAEQGRPGAAPRPQLLGLLHTLPHSVTTFSVCPVPVGCAYPGEPLRDAEPDSRTAVAVLAAVTSAGNVELVTVQRGALSPLAATISVSLGAHKDIVRGVRWLGPTARIISFSSEKVQHGFRNTLLITDIRNRSSIPFRELGVENNPMLGVRASPNGRYVLVLLRGAPSELWGVGGGARPGRVRVLDLPFTAVEWVLPSSAPPLEPLTPAKWMLFERSPSAKERSLTGYFDDADENSTPLGVDGEEFPEERLAFALGDGRVGVLAVQGRKVTDTKPKRPAVWGLLGGSEVVTTAVAAWGTLVILGDADGNINRWDTTTGRISTVATGQGAVRRIHFAPPPAEQLAGASGAVARVALLFGNGTFGVWELDARSELRPGAVSVAASSRVGRAIDLSWAPLPHPVGAGSVLALALEDGSLAFVDASQSQEQASRRHRLQAFKHLLGGSWPFQQGVLSPPPPLGSALLLPRPWALLLRLLLQHGLPPQLLQTLAGRGPADGGAGRPAGEGDGEVEEAVWGHLPPQCRAAWEGSPHRMFTEEAQELQSLASSSPPGSPLPASHMPGQPQDQATISGGPAEERDADEAGTSPPEDAAGASSGSRVPRVARRSQSSDGGASKLVSSFRGAFSRMASASRDELVRGLGSLGIASPKQPSSEDGASLARLNEAGEGADGDGAAGGGGRYCASLALVMRALARMRAGGGLLHAAEWAAYAAAHASGSTAARMAVAAAISGDQEEVRFWQGLPATLAVLRPRSASQSQQDLERALASQLAPASTAPQQPPLQDAVPGDPGARAGAEAGAGPSPGGVAYGAAGAGLRGKLWQEEAELAEARERAAWHEQMSRRNVESSEALQERRVLEYVALGDFQTAVGFLLASTPERSARYYRDALCTLALAAASSSSDPASRTLHIQAAKVVTAHAGSVGDGLLGVPLLCSAGLPAEAAFLLQDGGMWRYAATLAANALRGADQSAVLERWAAHILQSEGCLWRAIGVLTSAGALRMACLALKKAGLVDAAAAYVQACLEAGLGSDAAPQDAGGLENLFHHSGNTPLRRMSLNERTGAVGGAAAAAQQEPPSHSLQAEYLAYICDLLQQL